MQARMRMSMQMQIQILMQTRTLMLMLMLMQRILRMRDRMVPILQMAVETHLEMMGDRCLLRKEYGRGNDRCPASVLVGAGGLRCMTCVDDLSAHSVDFLPFIVCSVRVEVDS